MNGERGEADRPPECVVKRGGATHKTAGGLSASSSGDHGRDGRSKARNCDVIRVAMLA